jgi:4-hydroxybenzoate polyprenyltransferase
MPNFTITMGKFLIYSNLIVAISGALLNLFLLGYPFSEERIFYSLFIFFGILSVYNLQRIYKATTLSSHSLWLDWVRKHHLTLKLVSLVSIVLASVFLFMSNPDIKVLGLISFLTLISILYVIPIFGKNLRSLPFTKAPVVALVWTVTIVIIPEIGNLERLFNIHFIAFFFYFLALTIPFDIRDLKYDEAEQKTIPQMIGIRASKIVSVIFLGICYSMVYEPESTWQFQLVFFISFLITGYLVLNMNEKRSEFYCSLLDISMILFGVYHLSFNN